MCDTECELMRDLLLLVIVAIMVVGGYFVMDRLDHFLDSFHLEDAPPDEEREEKIPKPAEVENPCFQCYNNSCEKRVWYSVERPARQEGRIWIRPERTQSGSLAGQRGS